MYRKDIRPVFSYWWILILMLTVWVSMPAHGSIIQSPLDDNQYRYLELENGLRVILVSDPDGDQAAASLDISVGHGNDPEGRQGLAHFLEHMLFLGTEKYPSAGEYQAFIKDHGGSHNAYTTYGHTNYFFSVQWSHLEPALDRFSQFFISPLFNSELVKRERVIVDSEYSARSRDEGRRTWGARKRAMNPLHPRSRFAVGSLETLADRPGSDIRNELIAFYENQYSAHLMALSVVGRESLDDLEAMVRRKFTAVKRTGATRYVAKHPLYAPDKLPLMQTIRPLKDRYSLSFVFEIPSTQDVFPIKPMFQVANILGHEGEGSLLQLLKSRGWARGLRAGPNTADANQELFEVSITLTPQGVQHVDEIGALLFRQIRNIRSSELALWRDREQQQLSDMEFRFAEKPQPQSLVTTLSSRLQDYPWQQVLYGPYRYDVFDTNLVRKYLEYLVPESVVVTLVSPHAVTDRTDPWFDVEYAIGPLDDDLLQVWANPAEEPALALPLKNPFVPEDLSLADDDGAGQVPQRLSDDGGVALWHLTDNQFSTPRANFYFSVRSAQAAGSARNLVLSDLFTAVVNDRLNAWSYPAELAGLGYDLYPHLRGMSVRISGYAARQEVLLEEILVSLVDPEFDADRVLRVKDSLLRSYRNQLIGRPVSRAVSMVQRLLLESAWPVETRIRALEAISIEDLKAFASAYFKEINVVALSHGSRTAASAQAMSTLIQDILFKQSRVAEVERSSVVRLKPDQAYQKTLEIDHPDSVVVIYVQGREKSYAERARFYLLSQIIESDFYHELRTNQKLGYIVQTSAMPILEVPGMIYLVQSPTVSASESEAAIREFLAAYQEKMMTLDEIALAQAKAALITQIDQVDNHLGEKTDRYWRELDLEDLEFASRTRLRDAVNALTRQDMQKFYSWLIAQDGLTVRSFGKLAADGSDARLTRRSRLEIADMMEFKRNHAVF